jgi:choline transport protein
MSMTTRFQAAQNPYDANVAGAEVHRVRTRAPYSIITSTMSNAVMELAFIICLLFTIGDVDTVTNTKTGLPMIEVYYLATKSMVVTNIFIVAFFLIILVAIFNTFASVSRLTWAFARDHGLPFSSTFAQVS